MSGRPKLLRRLWRPALFALKQRLNYRIDLNEWTFTGAFKWLVALSVIGAALFFGWRWIDASNLLKFAATPPAALSAPPASVRSPAPDAPRPIVAAPVVSEAPPASETPAAEPDPGLSLVMEPTLKRAPKQ